MATASLSQGSQDSNRQVSPEWVRISMAAALALHLKTGRTFRDARCTCINLLQSYPEGCYANCAYCGLARERPGVPADNTFIRIGWPLYETDQVVRAIAERAASIGRVCISQVHDPRANGDLLDLERRVRAASDVPISALVSATLLDEDVLLAIRDAGADIVGIGLDAASESVFSQVRGRGVGSPHRWRKHWQIVDAARTLFGPFRVNCHIMVGIGETDRDLVELFYTLRDRQVAGYLFSFNPEPGTAMQDAPRPPLRRWRRIQLLKHLIEDAGVAPQQIEFDPSGVLAQLGVPRAVVDRTIDAAEAFRTDGCPDRRGDLACNRPFGSYRPGEEFRDYPFRPQASDLAEIRAQLAVEELLG